MNAVRSIVRALRINTRAIELQMGISLAQLFVLQQLAERPADSLNELAERTATHQSSVSVVVRRLVERGYVSRTASATDKRRIEIARDTVRSHSARRRAGHRFKRNWCRRSDAWTGSEQTTLAHLLEQWLREANIDLAAPPMLGEEESEARPASV